MAKRGNKSDKDPGVPGKRRFILEVEDTVTLGEDVSSLPVISLQSLAQCLIGQLEFHEISMCSGSAQALEKQFIKAVSEGKLIKEGNPGNSSTSNDFAPDHLHSSKTSCNPSAAAFDLLAQIRSSQLLPLSISEISGLQIDTDVLLEMPQRLRNEFTPLEVIGDGNCLYRALSVAATGNESRFLDIKNMAVDEFLRHHSEISDMYDTLNISIFDVENRLFGENRFANLDVILLLSKVFNRKIYAYQKPFTSVQVYDVNPARSQYLAPFSVCLRENHFVPLLARIHTSRGRYLPERVVYTQIDPAYRVSRSRSVKVRNLHGNVAALPIISGDSCEVTQDSLNAEGSDGARGDDVIESISNSPEAPPPDPIFTFPGRPRIETEAADFLMNWSISDILTDEANLHAIIANRLAELNETSEDKECEVVNTLKRYHVTKWCEGLRAVSSTHQSKPMNVVKQIARKIYQQQYLKSVHPKVYLLLLRDLQHYKAILDYCLFFKYDKVIINELIDLTSPGRDSVPSTQFSLIEDYSDIVDDNSSLILTSSDATTFVENTPEALEVNLTETEAFQRPDCTPRRPLPEFRRTTRKIQPRQPFTPSTYETVICKACKKNITGLQKRKQCLSCESFVHEKCASSLSSRLGFLCCDCTPKNTSQNNVNEQASSEGPQSPEKPILISDESSEPWEAISDQIIEVQEDFGGRDVEDGEQVLSSSDSESENDSDQPVLSMSQLAEIFKMTEEQKQYKPLNEFCIEIEADELEKCFNFQTRKFRPSIWTEVMSSAIEKVVPCSFNAKRSIYYYDQREGFCRMNGHCGGECGVEFEIQFKTVPIKGRAAIGQVFRRGTFKLIQEKPTNRPVRGKKRQEAMKKLQNLNSVEHYWGSLENIEALKFLHHNLPYHSLECVRKIKSESHLKERTSLDPIMDLRNLEAKLRTKLFDEKIPGFIHNIHDEVDDASFYLYTRRSLRIHYELLKTGKVTIYLDATGSMVRHYNNKQVLVFLLVGEAANGTHYVIAELVTTKLTHHSPQNFLQHLVQRMTSEFGKLPKDSFCSIAVCDFSYPIIYGYLKGMCTLDLLTYLRAAWEILLGTRTKFRKSIICICCAHLIKAFSRNLKRKLPEKRRRTVRIALYALARLAECTTIEEFRNTSRLLLRLFLSKHLSQSEEERIKHVFRNTKIEIDSVVDDASDSGCKDEEEPLELMEDTADSIRRQSPFYVEFTKIKEEVEQTISSSTIQRRNPCYSKAVVATLSDTYIALYPFWSRFMVARTRDPFFLRKSSAAVESQINVKKTAFKIGTNNSFRDYVTKTYSYFSGKNNDAMRVLKMATLPPTTREKRPSKKLPEAVREEWKRPVPRRSSKHFSRLVISGDNQLPETEVNRRAPVNVPVELVDSDILVKINEDLLSKQQIAELFNPPYYFTDRIIDVYLKLILTNCSCGNKYYVLPSHFASKCYSEEEKRVYWTSYIEEPDLLEPLQVALLADEMLHPLQYLAHWVLLRVSLSRRTCIIYDSSRPEDPRDFFSEITNNVLPVFEELEGMFGEPPHLEWELEHALVPFQKSTTSCGLHVVWNSEAILFGKKLQRVMTAEEENVKKFEVVSKLLRTTELGKQLMLTANSLADLERIFKKQKTEALT